MNKVFVIKKIDKDLVRYYNLENNKYFSREEVKREGYLDELEYITDSPNYIIYLFDKVQIDCILDWERFYIYSRAGDMVIEQQV